MTNQKPAQGNHLERRSQIIGKGKLAFLVFTFVIFPVIVFIAIPDGNRAGLGDRNDNVRR